MKENNKENNTEKENKEYDNDTENSEGGILQNARSFVFILLVGILCCYMLMSTMKTSGQTLPMFGGKGMAVVMTGSMEPSIPTDSIVIVEESDDFGVNDVVVIQDYYNLVVHRIVSVNEEDGTVTTKGDANNAEDDPVPRSQVRGVVTGYIPYVGMIIRIMKTPLGSLTAIAFIVFLYKMSGRKKDSDEEDGEADGKTEDAE